jgi:hypothetical protein
MFGEFFNTLVSVHFPGGRLGWTKANATAVVVPIPGEKDILYVLIPEEVEQELDLDAFHKALKVEAKKKRIRLRVVQRDIFNNAVEEESRTATMADLTAKLGGDSADLGPEVYVGVCRAVLVISMPKSTREQAEAALSIVKKFGVVRTLVVGSSFTIEHEEDKPVASVPSEVEGTVETFNRPITSDDVTNLTILIENAQTVEDLLNSL